MVIGGAVEVRVEFVGRRARGRQMAVEAMGLEPREERGVQTFSIIVVVAAE